MPIQFPRASATLDAAQAIEQAEQQIYSLHHEIRLMADLAGSGQGPGASLLSLETLSVVLDGYARRLSTTHRTVQAIQRQMLREGARGDQHE